METALVSDGAQRKPGSKLVDGNCDITIQIQRPSGACYSSLFVDVPNAKYRWISNTRTTKMCDFAVLVRRNNSAKLVLLELKAGMVWAGVLSFPHPVIKRPTMTMTMTIQTARQFGLDEPFAGVLVGPASSPCPVNQLVGT